MKVLIGGVIAIVVTIAVCRCFDAPSNDAYYAREAERQRRIEVREDYLRVLQNHDDNAACHEAYQEILQKKLGSDNPLRSENWHK